MEKSVINAHLATTSNNEFSNFFLSISISNLNICLKVFPNAMNVNVTRRARLDNRAIPSMANASVAQISSAISAINVRQICSTILTVKARGIFLSFFTFFFYKYFICLIINRMPMSS